MLFTIQLVFLEKGDLLKAEIHLRKAIDLNPDFAIANYNLGLILKNLGKFEEAKIHFRKAIEIDPNLTDAYLSLSTMQETEKDFKWKTQLFSESFLNKKNNRDLVNILFSRSNILHKKRKYIESAENLIRANNLKLRMYHSEANLLIKKTKKLKISTDKFQRNFQDDTKDPLSIFIVKLPRCGSTLVESIVGLNSQVSDLGEVNIFEESYREFLHSNKKETIAEIYKKKSQK